MIPKSVAEVQTVTGCTAKLPINDTLVLMQVQERFPCKHMNLQHAAHYCTWNIHNRQLLHPICSTISRACIMMLAPV